MSFTCGFFNAENGDRQYFNADLSNFLEGLITDGIYEFLGDDKMMVTEAVPTPNMTVNVGSGRAWFNGTWTKIDTAYAVNIPASDSVLSRIDALCLTVNKTRAVRDNYIEIIQGSGSVSNPTKPVVEDETNIFRHILCYVSVPAGCTTITQAQIENRIGMGSAPFSKPKWEEIPSVTVEQMTAQWQAQFDQFMDHIHETFDYDAAGNLQVGVENLAPTYDPSETYVDGDMVLNNNVLKKRENGSFVNRKVSEEFSCVATEISNMKSTFQDGVDAVYEACVTIGLLPESSTPSDKTPEKIAMAISTAAQEKTITASRSKQTVTPDNNKLLSKVTVNKYPDATGTYSATSRGASLDMGATNNYRYVNTNGVPNSNSGTFTPSTNSTAHDMGATNSYRYVNTNNVYNSGYNAGKAAKYPISLNIHVVNDYAYIKFYDTASGGLISSFAGDDDWFQLFINSNGYIGSNQY